MIAEEFDFEGGDPPPDGRSAMAEKALDRMMAEVSKRHQMESDRLSMNVTFSGVLMTMSAALLVYFMNRDVSVCWVIAVIVSIASIVPGIIEIHTLSLRHDGIQISDMVEEFNRHNYELVSYLLFKGILDHRVFPKCNLEFNTCIRTRCSAGSGRQCWSSFDPSSSISWRDIQAH